MRRGLMAFRRDFLDGGEGTGLGGTAGSVLFWTAGAVYAAIVCVYLVKMLLKPAAVAANACAIFAFTGVSRLNRKCTRSSL